jgi:hypothetical protein
MRQPELSIQVDRRDFQFLSQDARQRTFARTERTYYHYAPTSGRPLSN